VNEPEAALDADAAGPPARAIAVRVRRALLADAASDDDNNGDDDDDDIEYEECEEGEQGCEEVEIEE